MNPLLKTLFTSSEPPAPRPSGGEETPPVTLVALSRLAALGSADTENKKSGPSSDSDTIEVPVAAAAATGGAGVPAVAEKTDAEKAKLLLIAILSPKFRLHERAVQFFVQEFLPNIININPTYRADGALTSVELEFEYSSAKSLVIEGHLIEFRSSNKVQITLDDDNLEFSANDLTVHYMTHVPFIGPVSLTAVGLDSLFFNADEETFTFSGSKLGLPVTYPITLDAMREQLKGSEYRKA